MKSLLTTEHDNPGPEAPKNGFKRKGLIIAVLLLIIAAGGIASGMYLFGTNEIDSELAVTVSPNDTTSHIATKLYENGLIKSEFGFKLYTYITGAEQSLKPGNYVFDGSESMSEIVDTLREGAVSFINVTIPEGYTVEQIAERLEDRGLADKEEFLRVQQEEDFSFPFIEEIPQDKVKYRLEGFLFPDTYMFALDASEKEIISKMLNRFVEIYKPEYREKASEMELSVFEVITLASIVERETRVVDERPLVAAVFLNRIDEGMRLQSCATVQYVLGEVKSVLYEEDLEIDSPYNTYQNHGLPPGPIAAPGEESIRAVLYPADVNYLYFVAKGDGSHEFSRTLQEHNAAKSLYQQNQ